MIAVGSYSGGRTSGYMAHLLQQKFGKDTPFVFTDTGAEHHKTYEFIRKTAKEFALNLTCLRVVINPELGKPNSYKIVSLDDIGQDLEPFAQMMEKYGTPYIHGAFCTEMMKTNPFVKYCNDVYGNGAYECWLGMRADEPRRLKGISSKQAELFDKEESKKPKRKLRYLAEISDFEKQDVLDWWTQQRFDLDLEEPLGNCVFCIKKGLNKVAYAAKKEPDFAKKFIDLIHSDKVRKTPERKMPYSSMYRGGRSLESIIRLYQDFTTEDLREGIRSLKQEEAGSCSESCEAFSSDNLALFDE